MNEPVSCRPRETVELLAWLVTEDNYKQVADWVSQTVSPVAWQPPRFWLPDDAQPVEPGDYVLRGITGRFFRCTTEKFNQIYEVIDR